MAPKYRYKGVSMREKLEAWRRVLIFGCLVLIVIVFLICVFVANTPIKIEWPR
jgi:hypothetical protein